MLIQRFPLCLCLLQFILEGPGQLPDICVGIKKLPKSNCLDDHVHMYHLAYFPS